MRQAPVNASTTNRKCMKHRVLTCTKSSPAVSIICDSPSLTFPDGNLRFSIIMWFHKQLFWLHRIRLNQWIQEFRHNFLPSSNYKQFIPPNWTRLSQIKEKNKYVLLCYKIKRNRKRNKSTMFSICAL